MSPPIKTSSFVTEQDIKLLEEHGVDFKTEYPIFLTELHTYLKSVWSAQYHDQLEPLLDGNIDQFNKNIGFPSMGTAEILSNSFTAVSDEDINILSIDTRALIGYFYHIHLSDE
jgi:hypothetical protein